jgi:hypothetical protein
MRVDHIPGTACASNDWTSCLEYESWDSNVDEKAGNPAMAFPIKIGDHSLLITLKKCLETKGEEKIETQPFQTIRASG